MSLARELGRRFVITLLACGLIVLLAEVAHAGWVDAHLTGSDTRLKVEQDGSASLDLVLTYRVAAGALRSSDVVGLRLDGLDPTADVRAEDGTTQAAAVTQDEKGIHLSYDGKGLKRGVWTVHLRGATRFGAGHGLTADGALWRLGWTSAIASEGLDGARVVFDLPAGPTEPRAVRGETPWGAGDVDSRPDALGAIATLRRLSDRDELELVRPHVGRGEAASWAARVDPKAFPAVTDPTLRPATVAAAPPVGPRWRWSLVLALAFVAASFAAIVRLKSRISCAHDARPLIGLPLSANALGAGVALGVAVWLEVQEQTTLAAVAVAAAVALATLVARAPSSRLNAGGVWLGLRPDEAFFAPPFDPFDPAGRAGRVVLLLTVIGLVVIARALSLVDDRAPVWVALDAVALVPLFVTGVRASRAPGPARDGALLAPLADALGRDHKVVPWARTASEDGTTLELRLFVAPRPPLPGLVGLELGVGWVASGASWVPRVELMARVRAESPAHGRLLGWDGAHPASREPGRKTDERVFRWVCEPDGAVDVARALATALCERREGDGAAPQKLEHVERRRRPLPKTGPTSLRPKNSARPFTRVAATA